jgi:6-phosphogluconolactonase
VEHVDVYPDREALARGVAETVVSAAAEAIERYGRFLLCLAGGETPRRAYELLATDGLAERIDWGRVYVFFGDERCVPPSHERSNYRMARAALLAHVPLPEGRIHRIAGGERDPERAALDYARILEATLGRSPDGDPLHGFDLLLLGMGEDGHTASLFPGSVDERGTWVDARRHPGDGGWRITLTPAVLDASASVRFLVAGSGKAARLVDVLAGPWRPDDLPVQRILPAGEAAWMIDHEAAAELRRDHPRADGAPHLEVEVRT